MGRWGMVIDVKKCIACYGCVVSCKQEYFLPPDVFWNRVLIGESGKYPTVSKLIFPVLCNHCHDAPCVRVCPTGATFQREDGIVQIDADQCIGCRSCLIACPYQQRTFLADNNKRYFPGQSYTAYEVLGRELYPYQKGTVIKCDFCVDRVEEGLRKGMTPGSHREATPICVNACPVSARIFGDIEDPNSEVSRIIKEGKGFRLHPEFGTSPSVYYTN